MILNNRERMFRQALKNISMTQDGKVFLDMLVEDLVLLGLYSNDPCTTAYNLGKRDFMQSLVIAANIDVQDTNINYEPEEIENVR